MSKLCEKPVQVLEQLKFVLEWRDSCKITSYAEAPAFLGINWVLVKKKKIMRLALAANLRQKYEYFHSAFIQEFWRLMTDILN